MNRTRSAGYPTGKLCLLMAVFVKDEDRHTADSTAVLG